MNTVRVLLWGARILGGALLAFLLFMLVGALTGDPSDADGLNFRHASDAIAFTLFPVCTIIGLALAYRWSLFGGLVAVLSMVLLVILRPDLLQFTFLVMVTPGLLFVAHGLLDRARLQGL
jgi:hypothetical protein